MKIVEVTWLDTCSRDRWSYPDEEASPQPVLCHSVGYLCESNKHYVTINRSSGSNGSIDGQMTFPRACIKTIKVFRR